MFTGLGEKLRHLAKAWQSTAVFREKDLKKALSDVKAALLEADVSLPVADAFILRMQESLVSQSQQMSLTAHQSIIQSVFQELKNTLGEPEPLYCSKKLNTFMLLGLQGVGKTTTAAKLALHLKNQNKKVLMVSTDVQRPAARDQLATLAQEINVDISYPKSDSISEILDIALKKATEEGYNILLVDTAGRKHIDSAMMEEIRHIHTKARPVENLLVSDAMLGQESLVIAQGFHKSTPLTGLIMTRVDGDARGGTALSIRHATGVPIKFLGLGEKVDALEPFNADAIARRILGMGDTLALIDKIRSEEDDEDKNISPKDMNYAYLLKQMRRIGKLGGVKKLMQFLPKSLVGNTDEANENTLLLNRKMAIILSMTMRERLEKDPLNFSRKKRIVQGSGATIQEVNQMVKQLKTMRTVLKNFTKVQTRKQK